MQDFDKTVIEVRSSGGGRPPRVGDSLGPYRLEHHLGRGGMGDVFVARGLADEYVALKCIERATARTLYRFKREFRSLEEVRHPNLVSPGELRVLADGIAYYTMELVQGCDFVTYVRAEPDSRLRMARLLRATTQLVEAVCYLHEVGCIHRDIKPSNVLVTDSGRVVLLDFGLVYDFRYPDQRISRTGQIIGTPAYMAPEQIEINRCRPASDLYAIGVMLFELLYGYRPVSGSAEEVLLLKRKRTYEIVLPDEPVYPAALRRLVEDLLAPEPWQRPTGQELLEALYSLRVGGESGAELGLTSPKSGEVRKFVGRAHEIDALLQAHSSCVVRGQPVCVSVIGASGIGKTSVLSRFAVLVRERSDRALVLRGRCLDTVSVPYRGVDEIVDALSAFLNRLPRAQVLSLQPRYAAALVRLFPVLAELWPTELGVRQEPGEDRHEGVLALRELLARVADRRRLVIIIDDFHHADTDGRRVIGELLRPPDAPVMTLVLCSRERDKVVNLGLGRIDAKFIDFRELELGPLPDEEAEALVDAELAAAGTSSAERPNLTREVLRHGDSSPHMLIRRTRDVARGGPLEPACHEVIAARLEGLARQPTEILEYVAVAGRPISPEVIAVALGREDIADAINLACAEGLLVRASMSEVDVAHDAIRDMIITRIGTADRQALHGRLADALCEFDAPPELLLEHLSAAGRQDDALAHALVAAEQAAESFAFGRAIRFQRCALEFVEPSSAEAFELRRVLAQQLANDGRGPEASHHYVELARSCAGSEARELRRRAAQLLLSCGHQSEGLTLLREILRELGEPLPRRAMCVAVALVRERQRVARAWERWRRGPRPSAAMDDHTRELVETLLVGVRGLGLQDHALAHLLQSRALCLALAYAPESELALLVGVEALIELARDRRSEAEDAHAVFKEMTRQFEMHDFDVIHQGLRMICAFLRFEFDAVLLDGPRVWARLAGYPSAQWFRGILSGPLAFAWLYSGDFNTVRRECERWRVAALERGNLQRVVELGSLLAIVSLHAGEGERAHALLEETEQLIDTGTVSMATIAARTARALASSYEGRHADAVAVARATVRQARRSGLLQVRIIRCVLEDLSGRCELARCVAAGRRPSLLLRRRINRRIDWLHGNGGTMGHGLAAVLRAGLASFDGREFEVYGSWREAELAFSICGFDAHLAAVRHQLGQLSQHPGSEALRDQAQRYFDAHRVADSRRFVALLLPAHLDGVIDRMSDVEGLRS